MEYLQFIELKKGEKSRTYLFPKGERVTVENVAWITIPAAGHSQRLICKDGAKWIIPAGWLAIKIDADEWSV